MAIVKKSKLRTLFYFSTVLMLSFVVQNHCRNIRIGFGQCQGKILPAKPLAAA